MNHDLYSFSFLIDIQIKLYICETITLKDIERLERL